MCAVTKALLHTGGDTDEANAGPAGSAAAADPGSPKIEDVCGPISLLGQHACMLQTVRIASLRDVSMFRGMLSHFQDMALSCFVFVTQFCTPVREDLRGECKKELGGFFNTVSHHKMEITH